VCSSDLGSCWLTVHSLQNTTLQLATPRWIVGRMVSMFLTSAFLGLAVGSWLWGMIAENFDTKIALAVSAVMMAGTYFLARHFPLPETRNLILDPLPPSSISETEPTSGQRTGPVQIMIEHRIDIAQRIEFHRLMYLRRRHLTRLGARQWSLFNELGVENIWIESFQLSNWADFERLMSRRTAETVSLREEILAVQKKQKTPVTRRMILTTPGPQQQSDVMLRT